MTKNLKYILLILIAAGFTSCYTRYNTNLIQERKNLPQYEQGVYENYRLRVNDELVMRIISANKETAKLFSQFNSGSGGGQNSSAFRIYSDGTIDLPYVSHIPVLDKTLKEAEQIVKDSLSGFAADIQVKFALKTATFCMIGEAGRGYYPIYKERLNILQAIALAGGIQQSAKMNKVQIIRTTATGTVIKTFDIRTQSIIDSEFYYIYPNDIIYCDVSKRKFWAVDSYFGFTGLITSSITFMLTVWNMIDK
ncbi:MAG: polysaccharide biosynthesis/export family protein [Prevotellaceae bacterium]|jgi:polysaccharide export outer membrane protein|nr:polysaccharide biosynthesis/export family protein [Prevotellaceae bacterium]